MYQVIFFDFDGVLTVDATGTTSIMKYIETETDIDRAAFEKAYRKHNWDFLYGHKKHTDVWSEICEEVGRKIDIQVLYDAFNATPLDNDMFQLAHELKAQGYTIGMITDNKTDRIHMILEHFKLEAFFDIVAISADIGSGKKASKIFEAAIEERGLQYHECLLIDNNADNLVVPKEIGMGAIFYDHVVRPIDKLKAELKGLGVGEVF